MNAEALCSLEEIERLRQVALVRRLWDEGQPPDARAFLDQNPHLAADKKFVFHLAFEEYSFRRQRGETPEADSFSDKFPICKRSLAYTILANNFADSCLELGETQWPEPGDSILGFEVIRELGSGSFARVYLAAEADLGNRPVVVKISRLGGSREADILGKLQHNNIVPVYSVQNDPLTELTLVCMPYLGSTTLCDVLDAAFATAKRPSQAQVILEAAKPNVEDGSFIGLIGQDKPSEVLQHGSYIEGVVELGIQLADALAFVHERGIYHRDLKPSNVLVRRDGRPMLLDFNLSIDEHSGSKFIGGTPMYMSPEQLRAIGTDGKDPCLVDGRSDLFSLGVILFELLGGRHPLGTSPKCQSMRQLVRDVRKLQEARRQPISWHEVGVDLKLASIVEKCLAVNPSDRFQTAEELVAALRQCQHLTQSWARRLARRPKTLIGGAAAILVLGTALAAAFALCQPDAERQFQQGTAALQSGQHAEAIRFFSRAIEEEDTCKVRLARAHAHQARGDWHAAIVDFHRADQLEPSGPLKVRLAYCHTMLQPPQWDAAIIYYKEAIKAGVDSPVACNNLGYCLMEKRRGGNTEAAKWFKEAVRLDPRFQLAFYNRALIDLQTDDARNVTPEGLQAMRKVFEVGPVNARHHLDAARLYALAFFVEPGRWQQLTLEHMAKSLQLGVPRRMFEDSWRFQNLKSDPTFLQLLASAPPHGAASLPVIERNPDPTQHLSHPGQN